MSIANTPKPPYYAVIFTSIHTNKEKEEYDTASARMVELAQNMPGFLGVESLRDKSGFGITSVFWKDKELVREQIKNWTLKKVENLIYKINEIELLIKKNSSNSVNILFDFIITQSNKTNN